MYEEGLFPQTAKRVMNKNCLESQMVDKVYIMLLSMLVYRVIHKLFLEKKIEIEVCFDLREYINFQ